MTRTAPYSMPWLARTRSSAEWPNGVRLLVMGAVGLFSLLAGSTGAAAETMASIRAGALGTFGFQAPLDAGAPGPPQTAGSSGVGVFVDGALHRYFHIGGAVDGIFMDQALNDAVLVDFAVVLKPRFPIDGEEGEAYFKVPVGLSLAVAPTVHSGIGWTTGFRFGLSHSIVAGLGTLMEVGWRAHGLESGARSASDILSQFGLDVGLYYAF